MRKWMVTFLTALVISATAWAESPSALRQASFAGGCFWCTEAIFQELDGVHNVTAGMMDGQEQGLSPEQIARGEGGHAEVVFLLYDPAVIDYAELLEVFFATHDPTSLNKQGEDEGVEYRSAIYTFDESQRALAEDVIAELTREGVYPRPIVTQVKPASTFHAAAEKHQDYYSKQVDPAYCERVITPKVEKFRKIFADKLKKSVPAP